MQYWFGLRIYCLHSVALFERSMAQLNLEHNYNDLRNAIEEVPIFSSGMKTFSEMAITYLEKLVFKKSTSESRSDSLEYAIGEVFSHLSDKEKVVWSKYFDEDPPFQLEEARLTGSYSEGLFIFDPLAFDPPDVDFMCTLKNISFSEADQASGDLSINENSPFVNAYLSDIDLLKTWQSFLVEPASDALQGKICQLSSAKLKKRLHENYSKVSNHFLAEHCHPITDSPALKVAREWRTFFRRHDGPFLKSLLETALSKIWCSSDLVLAIRCDGWPQNAVEWIHRKRYWPPRDVIEKITAEGFHIVAKSSLEGNFRLSFSNAEGILVHSFSKMQHKVMRAFKAIIKSLVLPTSENKKIMCSYYLKTIMFWHLENCTPEMWTKDNVVSHLMQMIQDLVQVLRKKYLPMYFLRTYNLFSRVDDFQELEKLANKVEELSRDIPQLTNAVIVTANFRFYKQFTKLKVLSAF